MKFSLWGAIMIKRFFWFMLFVVSTPLVMAQQNTPPHYSTPNLTLDPGNPVSDLAYNPDGSVLAAASGQQVTLWDTATGELLRMLPTENNVRRLAFTSEGSRIVAAVEPDQLVVWNINFNYEVEITNFQFEIVDFAVAPNANTLALILDPQNGIYSRIVVMTDLTAIRSGEMELRELSTDVDKLGDWSELAFDPSGRYLGVGVWHPMPNTGYETPDEASVYVWDIQQNTLPRRYFAEFAAPITEVQFTSDGSFLLAGSFAMLGWEVETDELYQVLDGRDETGLGIGGELTASAQMEFGLANELENLRTRVNLRNWRTGETLAVFRREAPPLQGGFSGDTYPLIRIPVAVSSDGSQLATVDPSGVISLWNLVDLLETEPETAISIIAYCDELEQAPPNIAADQPVSIIWSWFATTIPLLWDHRSSADYEVTLDVEAVQVTSLSPIRRDPANDNHWTLYYRADVGVLERGTHTVSYRVTWRVPISDGLAEFGPGTTREENTGQCQFTVR